MDTGIKLNDESIAQAGPLSPLCVTPETPVREALLVLKSQHRGALLVCRDGKVVGIFTERDVVRILVEGREGDSVASAIRHMAKNGYRRLPVVDHSNRPVGIVDAEGIVHFLVQDFPKAVYNLPPVANPVMREREGP